MISDNNRRFKDVAIVFILDVVNRRTIEYGVHNLNVRQLSPQKPVVCVRVDGSQYQGYSAPNHERFLVAA